MANNFYGAISLTGGGVGALDTIDGAVLNDLDAAFVQILGKVYFYTLDDDSAAAEDSPNVISPDANAGTKRWVLQGIGLSINDTSASLSLAWGDTGFYEVAANTVMFVSGGSNRWQFSSSSIDCNNATGVSLIRLSTGTSPAFTFNGDTDTGMGKNGADELSLIAGGIEGIRVTETASETLTDIQSGGVNTSPILELSNTGGDFQVFRDDASPEGVITGSIGDLTMDSTGGVLYIKNTGSASNTGWQSLGAGVPAFSSMWYHGAELTTTIAAVNSFTKITSFENVGEEDSVGNAVSDPTTDDDITINLAGTYEIGVSASFKNAGGANKNMVLVPKIILASAKTITDATNATPIVVTSSAHGLKNGDMVTISGVGGNTAANGDHVVSNQTANTFELETLAFVDVAGNGAYTSGGTVDAVYSGESALVRVVSGATIGRGMSHGRYVLSVGDIIELVVANKTDANNFVASSVALCVRRFE